MIFQRLGGGRATVKHGDSVNDFSVFLANTITDKEDTNEIPQNHLGATLNFDSYISDSDFNSSSVILLTRSFETELTVVQVNSTRF